MLKEKNKSTVYGPVKSWRFGNSLGIDPIFVTSICSFNCVYCQLGDIQRVTDKRDLFVTTEQVLTDYKAIIQNGSTPIDVITFSGSGEPTLATNFGEISKEIRKISPNIPQYILSNGTLLGDTDVVGDLLQFNKVTIKLDATNEEEFQKINRPSKDLTFEKIWSDMIKFRNIFSGDLEVQIMLMPGIGATDDIDVLAEKLMLLKPDLVQINTPKRPYPLSWHRENRGNHEKVFDYKVSTLKTISKAEALDIVARLEKQTGLKFQVFS